VIVNMLIYLFNRCLIILYCPKYTMNNILKYVFEVNIIYEYWWTFNMIMNKVN